MKKIKYDLRKKSYEISNAINKKYEMSIFLPIFLIEWIKQNRNNKQIYKNNVIWNSYKIIENKSREINSARDVNHISKNYCNQLA